MNVHDSEKMLGTLREKGYSSVDDPEKADIVIFNTCAIRDKAEQKFFSQLGRTKLLKRKHRDLQIVVAGCVAQEAGEKIFSRAPFVDFVIGPQNIDSLPDVISGVDNSVKLDENPSLSFLEFMPERQNAFKAWVSIMYGCNNFCSYCIVPLTRGREVSRPSSSILSEIRRLCESGYKEITLLGQNVNSYRSDMDFVELLRRIDSIHVKRIRFVTSHPRDLSSELIHAVAELSSVCEHIHLPIQSGSDSILRLMNRRYSYDQYKEKIAMLRQAMPDVAITSDIIVGFPGESDDDFMATVRALEEFQYDGIYAFKYSPRKGTSASLMENKITDDVKRDRLSHILKIQEDITLRRNTMLEGTIQEILVEGPSDTDPALLTGRNRANKIITFPGSGEPPGSFLKVRIMNARLHSLHGSRVEN